MTDPIDRMVERERQRREKPFPPTAGFASVFDRDTGYEACKTGKPVNLRFEPAEGDSESLPLAMQFGCTCSQDGTMLAFKHSLLTVIMEGRNLHQVRDKIDDGKAAVIRAYAPKRWPEPAEDEAIVTKMDFLKVEKL